MQITGLRKRLITLGIVVLALVMPTRAQNLETPTVEELGAQLQALESSTAENKDALAEIYRQALASLKLGAEARVRQQQFEAEAAEAPALLVSLREALASPAKDPEPDAGTSLSLAELEARLQQAQAELAARRSQIDELVRLAGFRDVRTGEIPVEFAAAKQAQVAAEEALNTVAPGDEGVAKRTLLLAQLDEQEARIQALNAERTSYEARREVLPLRRDRAQRRVVEAEKLAAALKAQVDARRAAEGEAASRQADQQLRDITQRYPELEELATRIQYLAGLRSGDTGYPKRISAARVEFEDTQGLLAETNRRFSAAKRRIKAGGLTEAVGQILRQDYEWLSRARDLRELSLERQARLSEAQLQLIAIEEERYRVGELSTALEDLVANLGVSQPDEKLVGVARNLLAGRRDAQNAALEDLASLTAVYYDHRSVTLQLLDSVRSYREFIEKQILWVRSGPSNPLGSLIALPAHLVAITRELTAGESQSEFGTPAILIGLGKSARDQWFYLGFVLLFLSVLILGRGFLQQKRLEMGAKVRSYRTDNYIYTVRALAQTLLIALTLPLIAWVLGGLLLDSPVSLGSDLGGALRDTAMAWLVLRFLRGLLADKSVGQSHFKWPGSVLTAVRRELRWIEPLAISLSIVVHTLDRHSHADWSDSVGRACFVVLMCALALFFQRLLGTNGALWGNTTRLEKGLLGKTHRLWSLIAWAMPFSLAVVAAAGYYYTALQFELRLLYSIGFALGLVVINALLLRWLFMARRRLAVSQALETRAKKTGDSVPPGATESGSTGIEDEKVDIPAVGAQTRQLFRSSLTLATVIGLYFIWASVLPALRGLDRVQVFPDFAILEVEPESSASEPARAVEETAPAASTLPGMPSIGENAKSATTSNGTGLPATLTLADILLALVFLLLTSVAAKNLPALLELALLQRLPMDSGSRYAVSTIVRYLILLIGLSAASGALGVGWQEIQWLAAALTFGLAFGLQEIFANFVSGLIILLERPIRVGDIVTINNTEGRVTQLRMRATTIQDWDRRELLIPNKEFITGSVINWTLTDPVNRITVPVGIAYGSDTTLARQLLLESAKRSRFVLVDPAPQAIFRRVGESSLDFELRVFLGNRDYWPVVTDELHTLIDEAFRAAGIVIAFPQRDVHVFPAKGAGFIDPASPANSGKDRVSAISKTP